MALCCSSPRKLIYWLTASEMCCVQNPRGCHYLVDTFFAIGSSLHIVSCWHLVLIKPFSIGIRMVTTKGCGSCAISCHNASSSQRLKLNYPVVPPPGTTPHRQCTGSCPWVSENVTRYILRGIFQGKHRSLQFLPLSRILFSMHNFKHFPLRLYSSSGLVHPICF